MAYQDTVYQRRIVTARVELGERGALLKGGGILSGAGRGSCHPISLRTSKGRFASLQKYMAREEGNPHLPAKLGGGGLSRARALSPLSLLS